ncbi:MAG: fibronectin type III domain-containing protein, partial [Clostridia bacterium]|nr:fibronectin type III domain-containing protein [Clostridia bacterium]
MKQTNKTANRLLAVLLAALMLCSVVPAATFTLASAAKASTSAAAAKSLSKATVAYAKTQYYNGSARKPKVTVTLGGTRLKKNRDYTVSYRNNTDFGVGVITIKAKAGSAYTGSKTVKFKIVPARVKGLKTAKTTTSAVKLTWRAVPGAKGYVICRYDAKTGTYTKIKTVKKLTYTVRGLTPATLYRFAVRAYARTNKTFYGPYSKAVKAKTQAVTPDEPIIPIIPDEPTTQVS